MVVMKSSVFYDVTLCSPLKFNQCFGETCCLHLHGWKISQAKNQCEAGQCLVMTVSTMLLSLQAK
jgi:hypothetical protein